MSLLQQQYGHVAQVYGEEERQAFLPDRNTHIEAAVPHEGTVEHAALGV